MFVEKLPIPQTGLEELMEFGKQPSGQEEAIATITYRLYGLTEEEIEWIGRNVG